MRYGTKGSVTLKELLQNMLQSGFESYILSCGYRERKPQSSNSFANGERMQVSSCINESVILPLVLEMLYRNDCVSSPGQNGSMALNRNTLLLYRVKHYLPAGPFSMSIWLTISSWRIEVQVVIYYFLAGKLPNHQFPGSKPGITSGKQASSFLRP